MARQVSTRDRLVRTDQIENYAAIDIARGFARRDLKVRQIDSSHDDLIRGANKYHAIRDQVNEKDICRGFTRMNADNSLVKMTVTQRQ